MIKGVSFGHETFALAAGRLAKDPTEEVGNGQEHAKWSPVCTAFYKLHPVIRWALNSWVVPSSTEAELHSKDRRNPHLRPTRQMLGITLAVIKSPYH